MLTHTNSFFENTCKRAYAYAQCTRTDVVVAPWFESKPVDSTSLQSPVSYVALNLCSVYTRNVWKCVYNSMHLLEEEAAEFICFALFCRHIFATTAAAATAILPLQLPLLLHNELHFHCSLMLLSLHFCLFCLFVGDSLTSMMLSARAKDSNSCVRGSLLLASMSVAILLTFFKYFFYPSIFQIISRPPFCHPLVSISHIRTYHFSLDCNCWPFCLVRSAWICSFYSFHISNAIKHIRCDDGY